jgi:hypothetical protein
LYRGRGELGCARAVLEGAERWSASGSDAQGKLLDVFSTLALCTLRLAEGRLPAGAVAAAMDPVMERVNAVGPAAVQSGAGSAVRMARGLLEATRCRGLLAQGLSPSSDKELASRLEAMQREFAQAAAAWRKDAQRRAQAGTSLRPAFPGGGAAAPDGPDGNATFWPAVAGEAVALFLRGLYADAVREIGGGGG